MRVLLVDGDGERAAAVAAALRETGCEVVAIAPDAADLTGRVRESGAEVIVLDLDDPSRDALESMRALYRDEPRPVVVFAARSAPDQIAAALEAGVAGYVVEGLSPERVRPVMEVAILRFRAHQALRRELAAVRGDLAERALVDAAKRRLMRRDRLTEPEAHRSLRRVAMARRMRLADLAAEIMREE